MLFCSILYHRCLSGLLIIPIFILLTITTSAQSSHDPPDPHERISTQVLRAAARLQQGDDGQLQSDPLSLPGSIQISAEGEIGVEVRINGSTATAAAAIASLGIRVGDYSEAFPLISAWPYPDQLAALAALPMVIYIDPLVMPLIRTGSVVSQGDSILRADEVRRAFELSGAGVRVGVISNGVDTLVAGQSTGDLPPDCPTELPPDPTSCLVVDPRWRGMGDEGRAMLEIIHDLAPGAILGFSSGIQGITGFVGAIDFLHHEFQADVIVDDVGYLNEPFFEDGIISIRAQQAVDAGVVFISSAGNDAQRHYQAVLNLPAGCPTGVKRQCLHQFAPGDTTQRFTLQPGQTIRVVLQWDNPFGAAADDLDLYLLEGDTELASATERQHLTRRPLEIMPLYTNQTGRIQQVDLVVDAIMLNSGTTPLIEMFFITESSAEYITNADSIFGHPAVPDVLTIGAVPAHDPTRIQPYSSRGPVTISHPLPETRAKPDLVATDCVRTSVPGFQVFCGTSAAAPHVAALAALILEAEPEATPARVRMLLQRNAVYPRSPGFDMTYGAGLTDAIQSLNDSRAMPAPDTIFLPLIMKLVP